MKLEKGGFQIRNIRKAFAADGAHIGEVIINRRSGWHGGPSYQFYPNEEGARRGITGRVGTKLSDITREDE